MAIESLGDPTIFASLPVERRAGCLLRHVSESEQVGTQPNRHNFTHSGAMRSWFERTKAARNDELSETAQTGLIEAWMWLERELLIAPRPDGDRDWVYITQRGHDFLESSDPVDWAAAGMLQRARLDPELAADVGPFFRDGKFARAVGQAFVTVELRVRKLAKVENERVQPTDLMQRAFKDGGDLCDAALESAEQKATRELFAGAMGRFRNPYLHGRHDVAAPGSALAMIQFADLLLSMLPPAKTEDSP